MALRGHPCDKLALVNCQQVINLRNINKIKENQLHSADIRVKNQQLVNCQQVINLRDLIILSISVPRVLHRTALRP